MRHRKQIRPNEKVPLKLTATERKLVLNDMMALDPDYERIIEATPSGKPIMMTLDELDDFGGYVAAEANHCDDKKKQKKLDAVFQKVQGLLEAYTDEEPPQTISFEDAKRDQLAADRAAQVAEWMAQLLVAAEQLRVKTKPLKKFWLGPAQREVLSLAPSISKTIKNKLAKPKGEFTVAEVASMGLGLAKQLVDTTDRNKAMAMMMLAQHLMEMIHENITELSGSKASKRKARKTKSFPASDDRIYQFKITLCDSAPPIWRRIQIHDCTLEKLHEHIQTAMGWTNSHLHEFEINGERFGDPELLDDGFEDFECVDSTATMLSEILPDDESRYVFMYEYDFGDGWEHEVQFEGCPTPEERKTYPLCLEGERACPPEDVGGVWGYDELLEALADPAHERHEEFKEWAGSIAPDEFDALSATQLMRDGLSHWNEA